MSETTDIVQMIIEKYINSGEMPQPEVFRAQNSECLDEIERLQSAQVLQFDLNGRYKIPLRFFMKSPLWPREARIANKIGLKLKALYKNDPLRPEYPVEQVRPDDEPGLNDQDVARALSYLAEAGFLRYQPIMDKAGRMTGAAPGEGILRFTDIEAKIRQDEAAMKKYPIGRSAFPEGLLAHSIEDAQIKSPADVAESWHQIKAAYSVSKPQFGKRIAFVKDDHKRDVIFRDVAHAHGRLVAGFHKPAVILAGGVIEELLRLYLESKGHTVNSERFYDYIEACKKHKLLKSAVAHFSGAVKDFRNHVHLKVEASKRYTISKATAASAVNAIFTISNDFE